MKYLVTPKILYNGLSVYAASTPELNTVQQFLHRCHKRRSHALDTYDLVEKTDRLFYRKISRQSNHPLYNLLPRGKEPSKGLRIRSSQSLCINTGRFSSFMNRLYLECSLAF